MHTRFKTEVFSSVRTIGNVIEVVQFFGKAQQVRGYTRRYSTPTAYLSEKTNPPLLVPVLLAAKTVNVSQGAPVLMQMYDAILIISTLQVIRRELYQNYQHRKDLHEPFPMRLASEEGMCRSSRKSSEFK